MIDSEHIIYINSLAVFAKTKHTIKPVNVGTKMDTAVHLRLRVSFFIVRQAVEQGQCISENSIVLTAVIQVQPLPTSSCFNSHKLPHSIILPEDI